MTEAAYLLLEAAHYAVGWSRPVLFWGTERGMHTWLHAECLPHPASRAAGGRDSGTQCHGHFQYEDIANEHEQAGKV